MSISTKNSKEFSDENSELLLSAKVPSSSELPTINVPMNNEVVISGISCRLPESENMEEFSENLFGGVDMITSDGRRWTPGLFGLPNRCGKLKNLDKFDASFFGIHPKQANLMDPQLRILLELTYEAIVDSGVNPSTIRGSRTGVFIGASQSESMVAWGTDHEKINGYELTGCSLSMFANRISYAFDLRGPSFTLDTACSSSLLAVHQAVSAIRSGHCDAAVVGGVNLLLRPEGSLLFHRLNMLSSDGKCKSFDCSGDGYVRSEGAVVIFIQKKSIARRNYATIIHTKTNTDGFKEEGVTFPGGKTQKRLLEEIYAEAGIVPSEVSYIEAHGTGTKVGDPQELNAIDEVFCRERNAERPLLIGSVKSNMGHSEPASGLCSIAKVILAMQNGLIPANLHFKDPNADIPALKDGRMKVVTENEPWEGGLVGVNSFGFGGANVHVILESNPNRKSSIVAPTIPFLVNCSGRTKEGLELALKNLESILIRQNEIISLLQEINKHDIPGNSNFRGFAVMNSKELKMDVQPKRYEKPPPIWFIFSGMGSQWSGMGKDLFRFEMARNSIKKSAKILLPYGINLEDILVNQSEDTFENVLVSFVSIVATQIALVDLLHCLEITPDGIIGHSVGELACAYADGSLTAEQAMLTAYARGKAIIESKLPTGAMAAIGLTWEEAKLRCPSDIFLACHNAKDSVSVSGPPHSIKKFIHELNDENIFAKEIKSSGVAFHSKYIASVESNLYNNLIDIIPNPKPRSKKWVSTSTVENSSLAEFSSAVYHVNNVISPVFFQEALAHIPDGALVIEIGPHCLLQAVLKRSLSSKTTTIGLMNKKSSDNAVQILSSIGKIFLAGRNPHIANLYQKLNHPVAVETPIISPMIKWDHSVNWDVAKFENGSMKSKENVIEISFNNRSDRYIYEHIIDRRIIYPGVGYLFLVWKTLAKFRGTTYDQLPVVFENVKFFRATFLHKDTPTKFVINILQGDGQFEIQEGSTVAASGCICVTGKFESELLTLRPQDTQNSKYIPLDKCDIYKELRIRGYDYDGSFKGIKLCDNQGTWAMLNWEKNWVTFLGCLVQVFVIGQPLRELYLPTRIRRAAFNAGKLENFGKNNSSVASNGVPATYYKNVNIIQCPGIEIRGIKGTPVSRKQEIQPIINQTYKFIRHFDENVCTNALPPIQHVLQNCIHLVMENTSTIRTKVTEIVPNSASSISMAIRQAILKWPNAEHDMKICTLPKEIANFENEAKVGIKIEEIDYIQKVFPIHDCHLTVLEDDGLLSSVSATIKESSFILLVLPLGKYLQSSSHSGLNLIAHKLSNEKQIFLLRKKSNLPFQNPIVIEIDNIKFDWIEILKKAMTSQSKNIPHNQRIYLLSSGKLYSGIIGLINCLKLEPGGDKIRGIYIKDNSSLIADFKNPNDILKNILDNDLLQTVISGNELGCYRHLPVEPYSDTLVETEYAFINTKIRGNLSSLSWFEGPLKYVKESQSDGTLETCDVYYASLNFRDIMLATGKLAADALPGSHSIEDCVLGLEFSGKNCKGKRIMGFVDSNALATSVIPDKNFTLEVPHQWTLEEAATVPVAYCTAYYALLIRGRMLPRESVLIHSGSGGVGQAAISIALSMNCKVFTTVGSKEKKDFLKSLFPILCDEDFANSRDISFEEHVLEHTKGRGVDLVLNSLAEDKLQASLRCLAEHGRFLEIGKYDLSKNNSLGMAVFLKNVSFHGILTDSLFYCNSTDKQQVINLVENGIKSGVVKPLSRNVFPDEEIESAFRYMANGKHIGKVVIKIRDENTEDSSKIVKAIPRTHFHPKKSVIIVGGLGGFGLELAGWLIERGVKMLVLVSRSGITTGYQDLCVRRWRERGIIVETAQDDLFTLEHAKAFILQIEQHLGPVGAIFNLAMVLKDGLIINQTISNFVEVTKPKIDVTVNLDKVTRMLSCTLDHFVVFSSIVSGFGNTGQSNYAFANSLMEGICEARQKDGLPGLAIQWGAIGDVGVVQEHMGGNEAIIAGTNPQKISSCLMMLDGFLRQSNPIVSSMVLAAQSSKINVSEVDNLEKSVSNIFGVKDFLNINENMNLGELGMDSLMAVEVKQLLERNYDLVLSMQDLRSLTFSKLKQIEINCRKQNQTLVERDSSSRTDNFYLSRISNQTKLKVEETMPKECLVILNSEKVFSEQKQNIFIVHPIEGNTLSLLNLASKLDSVVYGLQCVKEASLDSINSLAAFYLKQIKSVQPEGPYTIAGYSFGCIVALEIALQLETENLNQVKVLICLEGSHKYAISQVQDFTKKLNNEESFVADKEVDAICVFLVQYINFDYNKVRAELIELVSFEERIKRAAIICHQSYPQFVLQDIEDAVESFYKKWTAALSYVPTAVYQGRAVLFKASDIKADGMTEDYCLSEVCEHNVETIIVKGNHTSFIEDPSVNTIAHFINSM